MIQVKSYSKEQWSKYSSKHNRKDTKKGKSTHKKELIIYSYCKRKGYTYEKYYKFIKGEVWKAKRSRNNAQNNVQQEEAYMINFNFNTNLLKIVCDLNKLSTNKIKIGYSNKHYFRKFEELIPNLKIIDNTIIGKIAVSNKQ